MKYLFVGDVHGKDITKAVESQLPNYDKFIFIGD